MCKEKRLISNLKKKKVSAFKMLYDAYAPMLRYRCRRYIADSAIVEDIMQDSFLIVFDKIEQFKGDGSFEGWLSRIFVNSCLQYLRKNRIHFIGIDESPHLEADTMESEDENIDLDDDSYENLTKIVQESGMTKEDFIALMDLIPEHYKVVFNLYIFEGYDHKKIAEALSITIGLSKTRLSRARQMMKELIIEQAKSIVTEKQIHAK